MPHPGITSLQVISHKQSLTIYMLLKNIDNHKRGPKFKMSLEQIIRTLFKLKYNLPEGDLYIVDTTTIRIGRGKTVHTFQDINIIWAKVSV